MGIAKDFSLVDFIKSNSSDQTDLKHQIELIIQNIARCERIDLYTNDDLNISEVQLQKISSQIVRIKEGNPIQYVLNSAPFYGRDFFVTEEVLIPRFDTELIIDILHQHGPCNQLLEIGVGSGNIAITIAEENLATNIIGTDIADNKISIANYNKKIICPNAQINFFVDDFFNSTLSSNQKFDIIVSNPPYIPLSKINQLDKLVRDHEPTNALTDGHEGYRFYEQFAIIGKNLLEENGFMLLEIGIDNKLEYLYDIFSNYNIKVYDDLNNIPRVIKIY